MAAKAIRHVPKQRMAMREDAVQAQSVSDTAHLARLSGAIRMARNGRDSVGTTRSSGSPRSGAPYRPGTTSTATPTPRCFRRSANCAPRAQNGHSPRTSRSLRAARCRRSPARRTPPQAPRQPPRPPQPGPAPSHTATCRISSIGSFGRSCLPVRLPSRGHPEADGMIGSRVAVRGLAARALQPEFQCARVALRQADPPAEAVVPIRLRQPEPDFRRGREPARERRKSIAEPDLESALSKRVAVVVRCKPGHGPARQ